MIPDEKTPWYIVARRLVPFILLQALLRVCYILVLMGYGRLSAREFHSMNL